MQLHTLAEEVGHVLDRLAAMQLLESSRPYIVRDYLNITINDENEDSEASEDENSCGKENEHKQHRMTENASGSSSASPWVIQIPWLSFQSTSRNGSWHSL